jgi:hypothetical protein
VLGITENCPLNSDYLEEKTMKTFDRIFVHLITFFCGVAAGVVENWIFASSLLILTFAHGALVTATHK